MRRRIQGHARLIAGERIKLQLFEMGKPFVAAYEPVLSPRGELLGALYTGFALGLGTTRLLPVSAT